MVVYAAAPNRRPTRCSPTVAPVTVLMSSYLTHTCRERNVRLFVSAYIVSWSRFVTVASTTSASSFVMNQRVFTRSVMASPNVPLRRCGWYIASDDLGREG